MSRPTRLSPENRRGLVALVGILCLGLQACSSSPTEAEVTIEDLLSGFTIEMADSSSGGAASSQSSVSPTGPDFRTETNHVDLPSLNQVQVPPPGTGAIFSWPVVQDLPISARHSGSEIIVSWPRLDESIWPAHNAGPPEADGTPAAVVGTAWMIYRIRGTWYAETVEWLRTTTERGGTVIPHEHLTLGRPASSDPVAIFVAGPSRHTSNLEQYRRRSVPQWFRWGDLAPWQGEAPDHEGPPSEPEPDPTPEPPPFPTTAQLFITSFKTEISGGSVVTFDQDRPVDLLSLRNVSVEAVDEHVPPGTYLYVSFTIDESQSVVVVDGETLPLSVPSGEVRVEGPWIVEPDSNTTITLDVNAENSLKQRADGSWFLDLQIEAVVTNG